jgi:hypothetical protein
MTDKMTVLFVGHSGHALAAVTRNADSTGNISAKDLARDGLLVRAITSDEQFEVPHKELEVVTVDLNTALLFQPRAFIIDGGQPVQTPNATVFSVELTSAEVKVQVGLPVVEETKIWVQVGGGNLTEPRVAKGSIVAPARSAVLQIGPLAPGDYYVLALVSKTQPFIDTLTRS